MTIETGALLKVVLDYVYPGAGTALNIFHYFYGGSDTSEQSVLDALETFFIAEWHDNWKEMAPTNAFMNSIGVQTVDNLGEVLTDVGTVLIDLAGILGADVNPAAVSAYIQGNTEFPQIRGSKYIPAISEGAVSNGILAAPIVDNLAFLLLDYLSDIEVTAGNQLRPGVLSTKLLNFVPFTIAGSLTDIPAYQRRRKTGVGI